MTHSADSVVKDVHQKLRVAFQSGKPPDEVWQDHLSDKDGLCVYSEAMRGLALGPWAEKDNSGRITWCVNVCDEYSSHSFEQLLLKDLRRQHHEMPTIVECRLLPLSPTGVRRLVHMLRGRQWRLLDVGSCYNPFTEWPQFDVTAIDIAPASETVLKCDFLNVEVGDKPSHTVIEVRPHLCAEYYDVVVFSLLLSYMPCTKQRLTCCVNAHRVLRLHGLLLVVTPDSSHQNKHASLMTQWRHCIEAVGFHRWRYEKLTHLHCMAFRKTQPAGSQYESAMQHHTLLAIPQDKPKTISE